MNLPQPQSALQFPDEITINGARINSAALMSLFLMIFDPDPERWYRFEKQGDAILVETRREEERVIQRVIH